MLHNIIILAQLDDPQPCILFRNCHGGGLQVYLQINCRLVCQYILCSSRRTDPTFTCTNKSLGELQFDRRGLISSVLYLVCGGVQQAGWRGGEYLVAAVNV
jgi:hypothetical protein